MLFSNYWAANIQQQVFEISTSSVVGIGAGFLLSLTIRRLSGHPKTGHYDPVG